PKGTNILCMLPDTGERYQSTALFDDVIAEMNDEEINISCSTPGYRFDISASEEDGDETLADATSKEAVALDASAIKEVEAVLSQNKHQIVMFSLEWCEFCWSVRKMMTQCGIPFITIDLDSVAYQENERGGKILEVLKQRNNWDTIPQLYIGDRFIGGATDFFDVCKDGELEPQLEAMDIPFNDEIKLDPYRFLPNWLHPR
ncbi:MAG: cysteine synthase A, partial [Gammaproteobacteria bacterium]